MSYQFYEIDLDVALDQTTVNNGVDSNYLAWMIGIDLNRKKGLWLIESVRSGFDSPSAIIYGEYDTGILVEDVQKYGYQRTALPRLSINKLVDDFTTELNIRKTIIADL